MPDCSYFLEGFLFLLVQPTDIAVLYIYSDEMKVMARICSLLFTGLCTNACCPYRHVNVNSKASVCEGFLRGYCRDGDEV